MLLGCTGGGTARAIAHLESDETEQAERAALDAKDRGVDVEPTTLTVAELANRYVAAAHA
jgi:hypothetical protein